MITTVTLNTSIDKAYYMEQQIENGTVMRVAKCRNSAGGKGINVARVVKLCGHEVKAAGFAGGFNGAYLKALLLKDGIAHDFVEIQGETRSCINILDEKYGSTEYLEPGCPVTEEEEHAFLESFSERVRESSVVTISGSVPKGMSAGIYQKMIALVKEQGKQVILDTSGELLRSGIEAKPTMVKPNQDEIEMLYNVKIGSFEEVVQYARQIYESGIPYVVVSLGKDGALLACGEGIYQGRPPKLNVVNTVGCGDSMVGGFAAAFEEGLGAEEALRYAVAVSAANAMSPNTGDFEIEVQKQISDQVEIRRIG